MSFAKTENDDNTPSDYHETIAVRVSSDRLRRKGVFFAMMVVSNSYSHCSVRDVIVGCRWYLVCGVMFMIRLSGVRDTKTGGVIGRTSAAGRGAV